MLLRPQRTIGDAVECSGIGFFTGADVRLRLLPAPADHGIVFQRIDLSGSPTIPARIEFVVPCNRRTMIARDGARVELIEHLLAALSGLQIDNCLIEIDGPEVPGFDGSCREVCQLLVVAGTIEQDRPREVVSLRKSVKVSGDDRESELFARPMKQDGLAITYQLDYGNRSPISPQTLTVEITPDSFIRDLAFARTFVLESEVTALKAAGYGSRVTSQDLLVFGPQGLIDNQLHKPDECVRHKILDCLGDFALLGRDLCGYFQASRSGHRQNHEMIRRIQLTHDLMPRSEAV